MTYESVRSKIAAAFHRLPLLPDGEMHMGRITHMLAIMTDENPKAGRPSPQFRYAAKSTCAKELRSLAVQARRTVELASSPEDRIKFTRAAKRLAVTAENLHQPTILALADVGFFGLKRMALPDVARRIAKVVESPSKEDIQVVKFAASAASCADVSNIKMDPRKSAALIRKGGRSAPWYPSYWFEMSHSIGDRRERLRQSILSGWGTRIRT
jgi:hypothetical protein